MSDITYRSLEPEHFEAIVALGNQVHGDNYLDLERTEALYRTGCSNGINASWVAMQGQRLVGFRLTQAAGNWHIDKWCSPDLWPVDADRVCYFKCNTVAEGLRGLGVGSQLLKLSVKTAKQQGAQAGLAHIWLASPGNSAFKYFSKCGGRVVKEHPNKWHELSINEGYDCPVCDTLCQCTAAEMMLDFRQL